MSKKSVLRVSMDKLKKIWFKELNSRISTDGGLNLFNVSKRD